MVELNQVEGRGSQVQNANQQDETEEQLTKLVREARIDLTRCSPNAPDRYKLLDNLAFALCSKSSYVVDNKVPILLEALEYTKEALELVPGNHICDDEPDPRGDSFTYKNKGNISRRARMIYQNLYSETKDTKHLDEAIKYGVQAVEFMTTHEDKFSPELFKPPYSQLAEDLAILYKTRFDDPNTGVEGVEEDLDLAIKWQTVATDNSSSEEEEYWRSSELCDLMVFMSGLRDDVQYINDAIERRENRAKPAGETESAEYRRAIHNDVEHNILMCRRWQMTKTDDDFQWMLDEAKPMIQRAVKGEAYAYVSDPNKETAILRVLGIKLATKLKQDGSKWEYHVPTLEAAIAVLVELVNRLPPKVEYIEERANPIISLAEFMWVRWNLTKKPVHGFECDMMSIHSAQQNVMMTALEDGASDCTSGEMWCASGEMVGSGQMYSSHDHPSVPLRLQRLCFVGEIAPENWIRKRNEDGTLEFGATEEDVDILEFCRRAFEGGAKKVEEEEEGRSVKLPIRGQPETTEDVRDQ